MIAYLSPCVVSNESVVPNRRARRPHTPDDVVRCYLIARMLLLVCFGVGANIQHNGEMWMLENRNGDRREIVMDRRQRR